MFPTDPDDRYACCEDLIHLVSTVLYFLIYSFIGYVALALGQNNFNPIEWADWAQIALFVIMFWAAPDRPDN